MSKLNTTSRAKSRPKRVPVSGPRNILNVHDQDPDFVDRWVNDVDNRVQRFKEGAYGHVIDKNIKVGDGQPDNVGNVVSKDVGKGVTAYLMRIPRHFYEEDQARKQKEVDKSEDAMKRSLNSGEDGQYGKVEIK